MTKKQTLPTIDTPKSLTQEELNRLRELRNDRITLTTQLGDIVLTKKQLQLREDNIFKNLEKLDLMLDGEVEKLTSKYGTGNIDINTGVIS